MKITIITDEHVNSIDDNNISHFTCDNCNDSEILKKYKYCPMCGIPIVDRTCYS